MPAYSGERACLGGSQSRCQGLEVMAQRFESNERGGSGQTPTSARMSLVDLSGIISCYRPISRRQGASVSRMMSGSFRLRFRTQADFPFPCQQELVKRRLGLFVRK